MATISDLKDFIHILTGEFTNQQQFDEKRLQGLNFRCAVTSIPRVTIK